MADYHAVLQRTLSGFTDPKPSLRTKLYERARVTIRRQLEGRSPALSPDAMAAELDRLEGAITQIEQGFDPSYAGPVLGAAAEPAYTPPPPAFEVPPAAPAPVAPVVSGPISVLPAEPAGTDVVPAPEHNPTVQSSPVPVAPQAIDTLPPIPDFEPPVSAPESAPAADIATPADPLSDLAIPAAPEAAPFDPVQFETPVAPASIPQPAAPAVADVETVIEQPIIEQPVAPASPPVPPVEETVDPLDQWAKEFMQDQPAQEVPVEAVAAPQPPTDTFSLPPIPDFDPVPVDHTAQPSQGAAQVEQPIPDPVPSVDPFTQPVEAGVAPADAPVGGAHLDGTVLSDPAAIEPTFEPTIAPAPVTHGLDDSVTIPPAPGFGEPLPERRRKGGFFKWLFLLILLGAIGLAGWYGWTNREQLMEQFGLTDGGVRPTPVRTITIKPETPEPVASESDTAQPAAPEEPKAEDRLTPDGGGAAISTEPVQPTLPPTVTVPEVDNSTTTPQTSAPTGNGTLPVSQNAILYEEGATASDNTVNAGRVVWSVVQEEPAAGEPKEPAIRGRVEIPDLSVVLIMTIKRNADQALPASHLIELVFAVPDDFTGGAIGEINRFVLKESEQGRGEGLVAVPARIADGIFLIALNNLPEAVTTNTNLLRDRPWIDIPLQYRTGRRALVTIEKGQPGEQVFKEVFEAWAGG